MPRRKFSLKRRGSANGLEWRAVAYFFFGPDQHNWSFSSPDAARPTWIRHERGLLRWWRNGFPADFYWNPFGFLGLSRTWPQPGMPWAWWKLSAPEPRRLVSVYDGRQRPATIADEKRAHALGLGRSQDTHECADNVGYRFEDDASYFARLGIDPGAEQPPTFVATGGPDSDE